MIKTKNSILLYLCVVMGLCMTITSTQAQTHTGNITVTTQAQVNALRTTLAGKTIIAGDLIIGYEFELSRSDITDLTPLSNITHIKRNLIIRRNGQLVNLNGLHNLQSVTGGDFRLEYNYQLTTVDFPKLQTLEGYFSVIENNRLTTLGNFPVLQTMGRFFYVLDNDSLTTLGNFPALRSISEHFSVIENNRLTTLGNFPVLTSIGLGFYNVYVPSLFRKARKLSLNRVSLVVEFNPELPDDSVRSKLIKFLPGGSSAVRGYIFINRDIPSRTYLGDITVSTQAEVSALFTTLIYIDSIDGDLTIGYTDNDSTSDITDLTPLGDIAHITGNLVIQQNGQLVNQNSLRNLQTIGGHFTVSNNARLTALDFSKLQTVGGYVDVNNNDRLTAFDFSKLQTIEGNFNVHVNNRLTTLDFPALQTIEGSFQVNNNDGLTSFGNFTKLQTIEGYVDVNNNDRLTTLGIFTKLQTIEGYFSVTNNDTLTTLGGFPALLRIGTGTVSVPSKGQSTEGVSILVENNPELSNCSVLAGFLPDEDFAVIGEIFINANTTGCNSPSTIDESNLSRVYISDITVRTQAELNALRAILRNIHTIEGSVIIGYYEPVQPRGDITDLTPFRNIVRITGNLFIFRNRRLVDLNPLTNNLQTIGGKFDVLTNHRITTLNFPELQTVGGRLFRVGSNDRLTTLNFPVLDSIKGYVHIFQSAHLNFPVLQTIEGDLDVAGDNTLNFPVLQTIEGKLSVRHSDVLTTLDFPVLQTVGGFFQLSYNSQLTTLNFPVLQTIGRFFDVYGNHKLTTLGVFPALEIIEESFIVRRNSRLTTLGNFPVLTSIGEHLTTLSVSVRVENNSSLSDCYILTEFLSERVHAVKGDISIHNNATDGGCNSQSDILSTVYRKDITVTTQAEVNALRDTLAGKTRIAGNLTIGYTSGNSRSDITDLTPLHDIVRITGNLIIQQNDQLANLNPLTNLQSIGGIFDVNNNEQLTTLGNFPALRTTGESFGVRNNNRLTTLGNFPELMSIGKNDSVNIPSLNELKNNVSIVVEGNDRLFTCCVLTDFFSDGVNAVSGDIFINDNATGCNSKSEINVITLTLTSSDETIAYNDPDFIAIDFTVGCGATGWTSAITYTPANANFITLSSTGRTGQTGVITLMARPTENTGVERTATITLSTTGGTASQTVVITQEAFPDHIYLGDITVSTQAEVDILRGTLAGKTIIRGNLLIGHFRGSLRSNIINLAPLSNIIDITGTLTIRENGQLINLNDLQNLQTIGGHFQVGLNTKLTNFGDFPVLRSIGGHFNVYVNNRPTTLDFPALQTIGGFLRVHDNDQLTTLDFPALTSIGIGALNRRNNGVSIVVQNNLRLSDCYTLREFLSGGAHAVSGSVTIQNNATNGSCNSQKGITNSIYQGNITVTTQAEVNALRTTLANIDSIDGNLTIGYTDDSSTRSDIADLTPLTNIVHITENLVIQQNGQLVNLNALNNLQTIGKSFRVRYNNRLTTLDFPALTSIGIETGGVSISVSNNPMLSTCCVLMNFFLDEVNAVNGDISINGNATGCNSELEINVIILTLTSSNKSITHNDTDPIAIDFTVGCTGWTSAITYTPANANFITLSSTGGTNQTGVITLMATPTANTGAARTATITLSTTRGTDTVSQTVVITQAEAPHTLTLTSRNMTIAHDAATTASDITFNVGGGATGWSSSITYTPPSGANFITLAPVMDVAQTGEVTVRTTLTGINTGVERTATITLRTTGIGTPATQTIVITQQSPPTIMLSTSNQTIAHNSIDPIDISFTVGGSAAGWRSAITYTPADANFITLSPTDGTDITRAITIMATPMENMGNERSATITLITIGQLGDSVTAAVAITQAVSPDFPTLEITTPSGIRDTVVHRATTASDSVEIVFTVGGGALGWTSMISYGEGVDEFITLSNTANVNQTGEVRIKAAVTKNGEVDRSATIILSTTGQKANFSAATSAITITQLALVVAGPPSLMVSTFEDTTINHETGALAITFTLGGTAKGWTGTVMGDGFITLNPAMSTLDTGQEVTIMATYGANMAIYGANTRVERKDIIILETTNDVADTVVITQKAIPVYTGNVVVNNEGRFADEPGDLPDESPIDFTNITTIVGNLTIGSTARNSNLSPLSGVTKITGNIRMDGNTAITNLSAFSSLDTLGGRLIVRRNTSLTTLGELNNLTTIEERLFISNNANLTTLGSFPALQSIAGFFRVEKNPILTSLGSFPSLTSIGISNMTSIRVTGNAMLSNCNLLTEFLMGGMYDVSPGMIILGIDPEDNTNNADGCRTVDQITDAAAAVPHAITLITPTGNTTIDHDVVVAQTIMFTVGGGASGWSSSITYTPAGANFITLNTAMNDAQTGGVTVMATPTANTGVERSAMITFTTSGGTGDAATATVTITQAAAPPTLTLPPGGDMVALAHNNDATTSSNIMFTVGGGASGWSSSITYTPAGANFITLNTAMNDAQTGGVTVMATPTANTGVERSAMITFTTSGGTGAAATATVTITQAAAPPTLTLPPGGDMVALAHNNDATTSSNIMFTIGGGASGWSSSITYTPAGANFITLNTAMNDAQTGGVTVMATPTANTGVERSAMITFTTSGGTGDAATATVTITQAAAPPTLTLPPGGDMVALAHNNDATTSSNIMFTVGGGASGWSSSITYTPAGANFITLNTAMNDAQTGGVTVMATPTANTGVERSAMITFTTSGGTGAAATATVTITQAAAPPTLTLPPGGDMVALAHNNDATTSSNIMFTVGGGASGWSSSITYTPAGANFITLNTAMNDAQTGGVTVMATPTANTGVERSAMITFTTSGGTGDAATATVTITQAAAPPTLTLPPGGDMVALAHNNDATTSSNIMFTVGGGASGWSSSITYTPAGANFITLNTAMNDAQTGGVTVTATPSGANTGVERSAVITFTSIGGTGDAATATVTITQEAAPPTLVLTSPLTVMLAHNVVVAQTITFTVGGSATGWTSSMSGDNFITLTDDGNETGAVVVTATLSSANMSTAARSAMITFTTDGGTGAAATATVTITQGVAGAPTLLLTSPFMVTLDHDVVTAQTITFTVGDATGWTSEITGENFITLTDDGAMMGDVVVTATPSGANTGVERSAMIMFTTSGGTGAAATAVVMITQSAAPPTLVLTSPSTVTLDHDVVVEQTIRFTVGGSASGWTSSMSGDNFITLTDDGNETGAVVVTATPSSANTGVERSAMITFTTEGGTGDAATQTVTITQDAAPALPPALTLSSGNTDTLAHGAGSTSTIEFSVANATWTATSDQSYVTLDPSRGNAGDNLMVTATAEANTGAERMATITITATGDETTTLTETVTVTQETAPTIRLTSHTNGENIAIAYDNTDLITIGFTLGGSAKGWGSAITYTGTRTNFIDLSLTEGTNPTGMITITATPIENMDVERSATIIFMTTGHLGDSVTAEVMITQAGAPGTPTLEIIPPSGVRDTVAYTATTNLDAVEIVFTVGNAMGWASMISYGVGVDEFITLSDRSNADQTGEVRIKAAVMENEGMERSATITLNTTGQRADFSAATREITIIQRGAPPTLMLTSHTDGDSIAIIHDDTNPITISFTFGGNEASSMSTISYTPENANFITLEPENNDESTRAITLTPTANTSTAPRTATITLITAGHEGTPDSVSLTIVQAAAPKIISISLPNGFTQPIIHDNTNPILMRFILRGSATSSMSSISYVPENANFIMLGPENNNEGTRYITLTPTANTTAEPRTATITLITAGHEGTPDSIFLTIMQGAAPVLELISNDISIAHDVTHPLPIFTVGGSATGWRSAITYTPRDADFITLSAEESTDQPNGMTIMATPTVNTGDRRTATITLRTTGRHAGTPVRRTLTITQAAAPMIMLTDHTDGDSIVIAYDNTDTIISFTLGGSATGSMSTISYMPENANFITLEPENNDEETRTITITLSVNEDTIPRTATITLRTTGHEGTPDSVSLTITQDGAEPPLGVAPSKPFTLYPNPTEGTLTIEGVTKYLQIYIYDLVGREVMTYSLTPSKKTVDVSDLPSGMYVVTLQGEDKTWTEVLMKR